MHKCPRTVDGCLLPTQSNSRRSPTLILALLIGAVLSTTLLPTLSFAAGFPWSGAVYFGHGTGVWPKNTVRLEVGPSGRSIQIYAFSIDTLCGKNNIGGRNTEIWPFNSNGSPAIAVNAAGSFSSVQRGRFSVPPIHGVTKTTEPGTYRFSITGAFGDHGKTISGHLSLNIQTKNGYFCSDTNSPFSGKLSR